MKISKQTIDILNNFSNICDSIFLKEDNPIITMSPARNVVAIYDHEEKFPEFGLYRLKEFLLTANLFSLGDIDFIFKNKYIVIKCNSTAIKYITTPADLIPGFNEIKDPTLYKKVSEKCNSHFKLTTRDIARIKKANAILFSGSDVSRITSIKVNIQLKDGEGSIEIRNNNDPSSHVFKINISDGEGSAKFSFSVENLILYAGDYEVSVLDKKMIVFKHSELPLIYLITSTI